jgi:hypothetical protein
VLTVVFVAVLDVTLCLCTTKILQTRRFQSILYVAILHTPFPIRQVKDIKLLISETRLQGIKSVYNIVVPNA